MVGLNWTCYGVAFWRQRNRWCWLRGGINPLGEAAMFSHLLRENHYPNALDTFLVMGRVIYQKSR